MTTCGRIYVLHWPLLLAQPCSTVVALAPRPRIRRQHGDVQHRDCSALALAAVSTSDRLVMVGEVDARFEQTIGALLYPNLSDWRARSNRSSIWPE